MTVTRREFLRTTACAGAMAAPAVSEVQARGNLEMPPKALGLLFDSTLCVGCKACVTACKEANDLALSSPPDEPWKDPSDELSDKALNVIKMYRDGTAEKKDREVNGFAFFKHSCFHCVDPSCVSVCPVSALRKDPTTGIVTYNKDACIGCRYCVASCPFRIPRARYETAVMEIFKCQLCQHLQKDGKYSACAEACPTGATLYGPVDQLKAEAQRRVAMTPGESFRAPRGRIDKVELTRARPAPRYVNHIYGENEGGGTQMLMLSGVPFEKFGLPKLPERSYASISETIQHSLYSYLVLPIMAFVGLAITTRKTVKDAGEEDNA